MVCDTVFQYSCDNSGASLKILSRGSRLWLIETLPSNVPPPPRLCSERACCIPAQEFHPNCLALTNELSYKRCSIKKFPPRSKLGKNKQRNNCLLQFSYRNIEMFSRYDIIINNLYFVLQMLLQI